LKFTTSPKAGKHHAWALIITATLIILLADGFAMFRLPAPELAENRVLAGRPSMPVNAGEWQSLGGRADAFVTDNFPPRAHLIAYLNYFRYLLGYSGSPKVVVGNQGWMFYNDGTDMSKTAGMMRLSQPAIDEWLIGFHQRSKFVESKGGRFYMLLAPMKEDIFPEFRPDWMPRQRVATEFDDFVSGARKAGIDRLVDPRPELLEAKSRQQIWHKYDTHWTGLGAYIGYRALMTRMAIDMPEMQPLPLESFRASTLVPWQQPRDLSLMLGIGGFLQHGGVSFQEFPVHDPAKTIFLSERKDWTAPQILLTGAAGGKTLLWIRDSFGSEMLPMLKPHFSKIIMVHLQDGFFRQELVEKYHPEVVLLEVIEGGARHTMARLPDVPL